jgi:hypothetical protein
MQQQPILTADEVLKILEREAVAHDKNLRSDFKGLAKSTKLVEGFFDDPITEIHLLEYCADFLRNKGIHVYLNINYMARHFEFIAGECGRVIDELRKFDDYLYDLVMFIDDNRDMLPPEVVATEKEKLNNYSYRLCEEVIYPLVEAYEEGDKAAIEALLKEAVRFVEETNEATKHWQRAYVLANSL